jgi:hypothetical protein
MVWTYDEARGATGMSSIPSSEQISPDLSPADEVHPNPLMTTWRPFNPAVLVPPSGQNLPAPVGSLAGAASAGSRYVPSGSAEPAAGGDYVSDYGYGHQQGSA